MADTIATAGTLGVGAAADRAAISPTGTVLRDITRGGVAGAIVGIVVAGLGGRLVMRLAALLQPGALGAVTENGNRIGDMTLAGTLALTAFGLAVGLVVGTVWVVVGPWVPGRGVRRGLLTAVVAMAIGTPELIEGSNPDFRLLRHDQLIVAVLIGLVGLIGFSFALLDGWLDRRLPQATTTRRGPIATYLVVSVLGALLVLPIALLVFLDADAYAAPIRVGLALLVVGLCTAASWVLRIRGRTDLPIGLITIARTAIVIAVILGVAVSLPHIARALGVRL